MIGNTGSDVVALYLRWNDGIFAHFFNAQKTGQGVRLTFDDTNLDIVAMELGLQAPTFMRSVGSLLRVSSSDPFVKFEDLRARERETPAAVGLLAAQVFVASNMRADDKASGANFWLRFNEMLLHSESRQPPDGYERLRRYWRDLVTQLNVRNGGRLGILRVPENPAEAPLQGRVHINYPLSQCMVRETDRQELARFFATSARAQECSVKNLVDVVADSQYAFSKAFSDVLRQAEQGGGFRDELNETLAEIRASAAPAVGEAGGGPPHRRAKARLKMRKDRGENVIVLQRLAGDWQDVLLLSADEWRNGVSGDDDSVVSWNGASLSVFVDSDDGFVTSTRMPEGTARIRVLYEDAVYKPSAAISALGLSDVELGDELHPLSCFQIALSSEVDRSVLEEIGLKEAPAKNQIRLAGGLSLGRRRFVYGAGPCIVVEGSEVAELTIDGNTVCVPTNGILEPEETPSDPCVHSVSGYGQQLTYEIVDLSGADDSNESGTIGFAISVRPPILRSIDLSQAYENVPGVKHLVGAELL